MSVAFHGGEGDPVISVCIPTYKRPQSLYACLVGVMAQRDAPPYEIIVVDNDELESARSVVAKLDSYLPIRYLVEPQQNIARARNCAVRSAEGFYIAFIDDDEIASVTWLARMFDVAVATEADAVFGSVKSLAPQNFPGWMMETGMFVRELGPTGGEVRAESYATSNVLVRRSLMSLRENVFDPGLGRTGGSDSECFEWLARTYDCRFVWCAEATVIEYLEEIRGTWLWHLRRWYRHGWVFSYKVSHRLGGARKVGRIGISVLLGTGRVAVVALRFGGEPRAALLVLFRGLATQLGKLGYLVDLRLEEYRKR